MSDTFDPHAWIRDFETAGGSVRLIGETWGTRQPETGDYIYFREMTRLSCAIAGDDLERKARREAILAALKWRSARRPVMA